MPGIDENLCRAFIRSISGSRRGKPWKLNMGLQIFAGPCFQLVGGKGFEPSTSTV
jgi:hypothetical protein